jgi:succinate-semialdehyde dehydrogenase/glutarate-semialdehyde dehydrogenase
VYPRVLLHIDGRWSAAAAGETLPVRNPATEEVIGSVAHARVADLDRALAAAERGFEEWKRTPAFERARLLRAAAQLVRERSAEIARLMTLEQGKVLAESRYEVARAAETGEWMASEAQRIYGRIIPPRAANVTQWVVKDPVGPVAAFTPWNVPVNQILRKVVGALAAGCSIIVKGPEETPAACAEVVRAYVDAGIPAGVVNLVFGTPAEISAYLVPHPSVRKVSFTGSTAVGKQLAALAGGHMKPTVMELGGHAPVLVFEDSEVETAARLLCGNKFRNAGQSCINPTRFLIERSVYGRFIDAFVAAASAIRVGPGSDPANNMGPLANARRVTAMEALVADALEKGAVVKLGGKRVPTRGYFFEPTVLIDVPLEARAMNEEPFGPVALLRPFDSLEEAIQEANRLSYGLAAYAFTGSHATATQVAARVQSGMLSINHLGLGIPETPFGGIKDSGHGFEGGSEAIEAYLQPRFITLADV